MDDELLSLADVYALNAVDSAERAEIEQQLAATDEATRGEFMDRVAGGRETLAAMTAADALDPPDRMRESVLAAITAGGATRRPRETAAGRHAETSPPVRTDTGHTGTGRTDNVVPLRRRRRTVVVIAGVAAAGVIIAAGGFGIGYGLANSHENQAGQLQAEVLDAADATLKTGKLPGGGSTTMVASADENAAVVLLHHAPAPPEGKVYQMWLMDSQGKHPRSVGLMKRADVKPTTTTLIKGVKDAGAFAITIEPGGGSKQPTTKPFSLISLGTS